MFESEILLQDTREILGAVPVTIGMALLIFLLSVIVGSLFALVEYRRVPVLRELIMVYKIILKGVPMVVVIFLSYFGLPAALQFVYSALGIDANAHMMPNWIILVIAITGCVAAFQAEIIKGALNAFDTGQSDAAYSLGYTGGQLFRRVLFPQVALTAIPDLTTSMMVIMKALSLGFAIEVIDIFAQSQLTAALNYYYLEAFVIAVVIYMVIAYIVTRIADSLEQALRLRT